MTVAEKIAYFALIPGIFLGFGIAIGHLSTYFTLRSMRNREEYLRSTRQKMGLDTLTLVRQPLRNTATGPLAVRAEKIKEETQLLLAATPGPGTHRRPSASLLARRQMYPLHTPSPTQQTLQWARLERTNRADG